MPSPLLRALRRPASDLSFSVFLVAVLTTLLRSSDLPSVDLGAAGTTVSIGPVDVALLATAVLAALRLQARRTLPSPWLMAATAAFALLIFASAIPNGSAAVISAGKLTELAALTLGAAAFLDTRDRLAALTELIVLYTIVAVFWGAVGFVGAGGRQASFLGEHDLAAIATMTLAVGLARIHARSGAPGILAGSAIVAGGLGITLGASLAGLLGLYLAVAAVLGLSLAHGRLGWKAILATLAVTTCVTAGTLSLRSGELGFIQQWFGPEPERPGQYAASWSQRLIYTYVGGRVFLDRPLLGTGWQGELPPEDFARYLPDARARFSDQPARYFPRDDGTLIPQQAYDQILFELGLTGAAVFLASVLLAAWNAIQTGLRWSLSGEHGQLAYVPAGWLAGLTGSLAGSALFGGSPLTATLWLTLGFAAAAAHVRQALSSW